MSQEKYGSEAMYLPPVEDEEGWENFENQPFVDRSALLKATLNSLVLNNVASVLNAKKHKKKISLNNNENDDFDDEENLDSKNKREEFEHIFEEEQEG
jgi:hypothetical protein